MSMAAEHFAAEYVKTIRPMRHWAEQNWSPSASASSMPPRATASASVKSPTTNAPLVCRLKIWHSRQLSPSCAGEGCRLGEIRPAPNRSRGHGVAARREYARQQRLDRRASRAIASASSACARASVTSTHRPASPCRPVLSHAPSAPPRPRCPADLLVRRRAMPPFRMRPRTTHRGCSDVASSKPLRPRRSRGSRRTRLADCRFRSPPVHERPWPLVAGASSRAAIAV